jgi:hypothetical protein
MAPQDRHLATELIADSGRLAASDLNRGRTDLKGRKALGHDRPCGSGPRDYRIIARPAGGVGRLRIVSGQPTLSGVRAPRRSRRAETVYA